MLVTGGAGGWAQWFLQSVLLEIGGAMLFGWVAGFVAGRLLDWALRKKEIERTSRLAYTVALSIAALGAASLLHINEVLAVFVTGLSFDNAVSEGERSEEEGIQEAINRFFMLPVFVLLGITLPWVAWRGLGLPGVLLALALVALRRLPAVLLMRPLLGHLHGRADVFYVGWFGPIGVAALYYGLHAKQRTQAELPWTVVTLVVVVSLLVHGLSATPLTRLYGRRGGVRAVAQERQDAPP